MQIVLKGLIIGQDSYNDDVLYKENSSSPYSSGIGSTIQEKIENRDGVKNFDTLTLVYHDNMYISEVEYNNKIIYPSLNYLNSDILSMVENSIMSS